MSNYTPVTLGPTASSYSGIDDADYLNYDAETQKAWAAVDATKAKQKAIEDQISSLYQQAFDAQVSGGDASTIIYNINKLYNGDHAKLDVEVQQLMGKAQEWETKRENRGAIVQQLGVNAKASAAADSAISEQNLLLQNINQELTGRISQNNTWAAEAIAGQDTQSAAEVGRAKVRAARAGYDVEGSGTLGAMADAATRRSEEDKAAIETYRVSRQNLLMGQQEAATSAAETLTADIADQTASWKEKANTSLESVTENLLTNVQTELAGSWFRGDTKSTGVQTSQDAVTDALSTWSYDEYESNTLDTLTENGANQTTWDQMVLETQSKQANPYAQFGSSSLGSLKSGSGSSSNLLAAASGSDSSLDNVYKLSGSKYTGLL